MTAKGNVLQTLTDNHLTHQMPLEDIDYLAESIIKNLGLRRSNDYPDWSL